MTHLELENLISEHLEGQLTAVRRAEVETHLATCEGCRMMVEDVRRALDLCRAAEPVEPPPWLVPRILRATLGERKPSLQQRLAAWFRPVLHTRAAYGVAMAVFSLSMIINVAGINLRHVRPGDLNPVNWAYQVNRNGHLLVGRIEKYCYDLKVVYEFQSRLQRLRAQPSQPTRPEPPAGGSTYAAPADEEPLASVWNSNAPFQFGSSGQVAEAGLPVRADGWKRSARSTSP
jgi:Putative zinc-finger